MGLTLQDMLQYFFPLLNDTKQMTHDQALKCKVSQDVR